jgi:hypothetical protein
MAAAKIRTAGRTPAGATASNDTKARFAAWLCTGPVGHLAAGVLDWLELLARHLLHRSTIADGDR